MGQANDEQSAPEATLQLLKLITGEVVLAEVWSVDGDVTLRHPLVLQHVPAEMIGGARGQIAISVQEFLPGAMEDVLVMSPQHIIAVSAPEPRLVELYNKTVNPSAIAMPNKELMLP